MTALDRRYRRLIKRANRDFGGPDVCHGCGRPLAEEITLAGRAHGRFKVVAKGCCGSTLSEIVGFAIYITPPKWISDAVAGANKVMVSLQASDPWSRADRDWFAQNPTRTHRLRRVFPGEWPTEGGFTHVVVRQGAPGERVRLPFKLTERLALHDDVPEAEAWALFDLIAEHQKRHSREISVAEVFTRWKQLDAGGNA
jgi:hypothetical protein